MSTAAHHSSPPAFRTSKLAINERARLLLYILAALLLSSGCDGGRSLAIRSQPQATDPPPMIVLDASSRNVIAGERVRISWATRDAATCTASDGWTGSRPGSGSEESAPLTATTRFALTCEGKGGTTSTVLSVTASPPEARFPLRVSKRHLIDAAGNPFLVQGDSPWSLIVQLKREDVEHYLRDRRARGFNTLLVNLIERRFSNQPPANAYGDGPFLEPGDFSKPNDAYFDHAGWVLQRAEQMGFAVLLVPAYLGWKGGEEGWYRDLIANSDDSLRSYGQYIGLRYRHLRNIIWTYGGDFDPPKKSTVNLIAAGIRAVDPDALATAHNAPESSPADFWSGEPWLDIHNVYTAEPVYRAALAEYARTPDKPFFLMESVYENERGIASKRMRVQAYHALLSGAAGQVFGNNPVWHFNARNPLYPAFAAWTEALGQPGSVSMTRLWDVFSARRWWELVPDASNDMLVGGVGDGHERAVAAFAQDRTFAIAYLPESRRIAIDLRRFTGPRVNATWVEPLTGAHSTAAGSPFPADEIQSLTPPAKSPPDAGDWVLLLESVALE